ncbi:hypothetical protein [Raineyella sp. W15-4]|uniref:hypothetical protein n=1 Tax=Raineyella sp. W15-4 TaxID=3081651 RepID=UPI0029557CF2|nr:hypothetical protein [Raineyella sp. W15-4]WOQ17369.1 hypothetical protein R0145_01250 [Raineyella sp. W15-4]
MWVIARKLAPSIGAICLARYEGRPALRLTRHGRRTVNRLLRDLTPVRMSGETPTPPRHGGSR